MDKTVLIADDEKDVLESTALVIESLGYKVIRVDDPAAVLDMARDKQPGVILQDIRMPNLNLSGLVAAIHTDPATAHIPVVLYGAGREVGALATRLNAWGYLSKPFMKGELSRLLGQAFGGSEGSHTAQRDFQRDVQGLFSDVWDQVTAANNYVRVLELQRGLPDLAHRSVRGMTESLINLETRLNRLRVYVSGLVAAVEPAASGQPNRPMRPGKRGEGTPAKPAPDRQEKRNQEKVLDDKRKQETNPESTP